MHRSTWRATSCQVYFNGATTASVNVTLSGTLAAGDVFVFAHSASSAAILAQADLTSGSGLWNGDDAIVLRKGDAVVDSIGQVGVDPGTEWGTGLTSTADNTLRRKATVEAGDTDPSDAFDPATAVGRLRHRHLRRPGQPLHRRRPRRRARGAHLRQSRW